jgi:hypothetical protein
LPCYQAHRYHPPLRHTINASGVSWNKGVLDPTGAQMVLTLKLISTAMCLQDSKEKKLEVGTGTARVVLWAPRGGSDWRACDEIMHGEGAASWS